MHWWKCWCSCVDGGGYRWPIFLLPWSSSSLFVVVCGSNVPDPQGMAMLLLCGGENLICILFYIFYARQDMTSLHSGQNRQICNTYLYFVVTNGFHLQADIFFWTSWFEKMCFCHMAVFHCINNNWQEIHFLQMMDHNIKKTFSQFSTISHCIKVAFVSFSKFFVLLPQQQKQTNNRVVICLNQPVLLVSSDWCRN